MDHFITPATLAPRLPGVGAPRLLDLRTPEDTDADPTRLPGAVALSLAEVEAGAGGGTPAVVYCQKGGKFSQLAAAMLRLRGTEACVLTGGHLAWQAAGLPTVTRDVPARWVMAATSDGHAIATLWLLRRIIAPAATVLPVAADQVEAAAGVWPAEVLPPTPAALAALVGLSHPLVDALEAMPNETLDHVLRGRLARTGDPFAALNLIDDHLAGMPA